MKAADIMTRNVQVVRPEDSVQKAASIMDNLKIGLLPDGKRVVGVIADRDITVRAVSADLSPNMTNVDDALTDEVHFCLEDHAINEVEKHMIDTQIRRLLAWPKL